MVSVIHNGLVTDAATLLRDIAGDAAAVGASRIKPSEDQLAQIDQPAEENVWHEKHNIKEELKARFHEEANRYKRTVCHLVSLLEGRTPGR
jgi:hypothetical protein